MKAFDPNYKLLDEMYQDDYYPAFFGRQGKPISTQTDFFTVTRMDAWGVSTWFM